MVKTQMKYDVLDESYWRSQVERVERLRSKISERAQTPTGRVVPDDTDLVIGTGRRISATVMFIDITGFTRRPSATAAEQEMILRILNLFLTEMIYVIEDYGGVVEKNTGDGLMAYFEDRSLGTSGGNSVQRAVACALTMAAVNYYLISPVLIRTNVPPIRYRTSMDHGPITIARIGASHRCNANVAIGNTANFAAHMLDKIEPNAIGLGNIAAGNYLYRGCYHTRKDRL